MQAACQGTPGLCCLSGALALGVLRADLHRGIKNNYQISKEHNPESWLAAKENDFWCIEMNLFNDRKDTIGASLWSLLSLTRTRMSGCLGQWVWEVLWGSWKWHRYSFSPSHATHSQPQCHIGDSLNVFSYMLGQRAWKNLQPWAPKSGLHPSKLQSRQVNKRNLKQREEGKKERVKPYGWKPIRTVKAASFEGDPTLVKLRLYVGGKHLLKVTPNTTSDT